MSHWKSCVGRDPKNSRVQFHKRFLKFSPGNPLQVQRHVFVDCLISTFGQRPRTRRVQRASSCVFVWTTTKLWICCVQPPRISQGLTTVEETCAPFQFALSTRAGTDCVDHAIRAATDADHEATVLSIDGVGAYGHVHQSAMLSKLLEVPSLQPLLPFVRAAYTEPARYKWQDDEGHRHDIEQHEGGEQGDPLMPLLFSLCNPQRIGGRQRRVGSRRDVVRVLGRHFRVVQA